MSFMAQRGRPRLGIIREPLVLFLGIFLGCLGALALALPLTAGAGTKGTSAAQHQSKPPSRPIAPGKAQPFETGPNPQAQAPDITGGPDAFGYVFADDRDPGGPVYNWQPGVDRVPDDQWVLVRHSDYTDPWDDGVVTRTLPFAFSFYGTNYTQLHIGTNGNVHFGLPNDYWPGKSGACLPSSSPYVPQAMAAPLWYDFVVPHGANPDGGVYTTVLGAAPNRTYVVEWRNVYDYNSPNTRATFEVFINEDGSIVYQYQLLNGSGVGGSRGVVGIQNATGTIGLPYSCYQDSLVPERAIRYRVQPAAVFTPVTAAKGGAPGVTLTYSETLVNQTGIANSFTITATGNTWTTTVQPDNTGTIQNGVSVPVQVQVQIPQGEPLGASDVAHVLVSSALPNPGTFTATAVLTSSVSSYGVDFSPSNLSRAGDYGAPVTYTIGLINQSGITNDFVMAAEGNQWSTAITPAQLHGVPAGASVPVTVSVHVPPDASLGARDVVSVTATGQFPVPGQYYGGTVLTTTAGLWRLGSDMPVPRSRAAAVAFPANGRIYSIGGEFGNGNTNPPIEEYDPVADVWTQRTSLPLGVSNIGASAIGSAIYIPGGYNGNTGHAERRLQVYYPLEDVALIVATDPLPAPRLGAGVAAYNGKLYVIGGADDSLAATNTVFEFDPAAPAGSRWHTRAPMPTARLYLGAAELDGLIYAVGGIPGAPDDLSTVEAYDPASDTWSPRRSMEVARGGLALVGVDSSQPGCGGHLFALGGGYLNHTASAELYDPSTDSWEPISNMLLARRSLSGVYSPSTYSLAALGGWTAGYEAVTESVRCAGTLQPPTPTPVPSPVCTISFTDVPEGSTFYPFVRCLACQGIISGYEDGTFRPNAEVTRGQLSKIVSNAAGFGEDHSERTFEDVPQGSTFYIFVERMASRGIIGGYPCGGAGEPCGAGNRPYFRPNANATRGQISKIVSNSAGIQDPTGAQIFADVPPGSTFFDWIQRLANRAIMSGYPCGGAGEPCGPGSLPYFRPNANATRGQTSKIVSNTFFPGCNPTLRR